MLEEWNRLVLEESINALENEDEGDSDCFVASKWYMVGGFYWKKQDTAVIAPNTYGTLYRNTLDGEWRVARVLEDQHSLEVERMVGGKKVKKTISVDDFYVRDFARPAYVPNRLSFLVAMALMTLHMDKVRILGRNGETLEDATVWKEFASRAKGGWSEALLQQGLSANFIDIEYALSKKPDFSIPKTERKPLKEKRKVFSSINDVEQQRGIPNLSYMEAIPSQGNHSTFCWIAVDDPAPIQNLVKEEYQLSTKILSHDVGVERARRIREETNRKRLLEKKKGLHRKSSISRPSNKKKGMLAGMHRRCLRRSGKKRLHNKVRWFKHVQS